MSDDFDQFEFNSSDLDDADPSNENNEKKENKSESDTINFPEPLQSKQKNLSVINFSALKPPNGSSITISDAPNDSLNLSRPPLLPARLTSMMASTPSQNKTADEENKPKFDLPPLNWLDDDDDDSNENDQPNLGPIQFPADPDLDKKDQKDSLESKDRMDSITINSVSNNTSIFANPNKNTPDSPLKMNMFSDDEKNDQNNNDLNNSMQPQFLPDLSISQNNDSKPLDNFDEIDVPHPLIPSRKRDSLSSLPSQSPQKLSRNASKPSFLNMNEIKNIKPGDPVPNNDLVSLSTSVISPEKSADPMPLPTITNTMTVQAKSSNDALNQIENKEETQNNNLNVVAVDDDDGDIDFSSVSLNSPSDDEKNDKIEPKIETTQNNNSIKKETPQKQAVKDITPQPISDNFTSTQSIDQKTSQIQMTNDSQSIIPSQAKHQPSPLNNSDTSNDFFMESDTTQQSKSDQQNEIAKGKLNHSTFQTNPIASETFQSAINDSSQPQQMNKSNVSINDNVQQKKSTPPNTENRKPKTELAESAQKVKQIIQQSAKKQQQQKLQKQSNANENRIQKQNQQVISPPIQNSTETPLNFTSQSPSPPVSSSGSFHENEQDQPNVSNKTQTVVNITKTDEPLSSVSLHLSSDQQVQNQPVKKRVTKMAIEIGVENAFDNASAQFQRLFLNEFSSLMRPTFQMPYDTDVDNFIDYLSKDINKELSSINKSYSPTSRKINGISQKIEMLFDQGKDVLNEKLANSYEDDLQKRAQNYQKLKNLQALVDDLNKNFSAKITKTMKVIDNYIKDSSLLRSNKLMKAQVLQKNLRELTLERMHLEAKVNKQLSEFEEIDRRQNEVMMSYISFTNDPSSYDSEDQEKATLYKKIAREIALISSNVDKATFNSLVDMSNEGQFHINEERTKIREEFSKMDGFAEKLKLLKQKNLEKKSSSKKKESKKKKS